MLVLPSDAFCVCGLQMQYFKPALFTLAPFAGSIPGGMITRHAIKDWYDKVGL